MNPNIFIKKCKEASNKSMDLPKVVYVVTEYEQYEDTRIVGIFYSRDAADKVAESFSEEARSHEAGYYLDYSVRTVVVGDILI